MSLRAESIDVGYETSKPVLSAITAEFEAGHVTAIVGPNGAGKSTLLRVLGGWLRPWKGRVLLAGKDLRQIAARERAGGLAYVAQRPRVSARYTVRDVVALGRYALPRDNGAIDSAMHECDLAEHAGAWFHDLSVGQQHRVAFARALAQLSGWQSRPLESGVLLADEPIAAMDPRHAVSTLATLRALAAEQVAVVLVVHDVGAATRMADRAVLLDRGGGIVSAGAVHTALAPDLLQGVFEVPFETIPTPDGRTITTHLSSLGSGEYHLSDTMETREP